MTQQSSYGHVIVHISPPKRGGKNTNCFELPLYTSTVSRTCLIFKLDNWDT